MSAWSINLPMTEADVEKSLAAGERLPLIIKPHLGMGDAILCNGLFRALHADWNVTVTSYRHNHINIGTMLRDTGIIVRAFEGEDKMDNWIDQQQNHVVLRLGYASPPFDRWHFDEEFYRQAGVPFSERWDGFTMPAVPQLPIPYDCPYFFIHDKPGRSIVQHQGSWFRPVDGDSIFAYKNIILGASELHCISSSFAALADTFDLSGKKLFFYAQGIEIPKHRNKWEYK